MQTHCSKFTNVYLLVVFNKDNSKKKVRTREIVTGINGGREKVRRDVCRDMCPKQERKRAWKIVAVGRLLLSSPRISVCLCVTHGEKLRLAKL